MNSNTALPLIAAAQRQRSKALDLLRIAGLGLLLAGCGKHPLADRTSQSSSPAAQVRVQTAESKPQVLTEEVAGTVRAKTHATLEAKVSGRIEQMPVVLGQRVKAGDLVARLAAAEITARLEQAQASLQQVARDWNRVSNLFQGQAATPSEYETAEARLRGAKAAMAEAEAMMRYVEVTAPFDGVISRKWAEMGDLAAPGKPLVEMEDPATLQLEAEVPEALSSHVTSGLTLAIRVDQSETEIRGTVAEISPAADPATRTVRVKVDLAPASGLKPGQFARLLVPMGQSHSVELPVASVVQRGQLEMVFVVTNQQAHLHLVKTGKRTGQQVQILSGLDAGDVVAVDGASLLADGQAVEVAR